MVSRCSCLVQVVFPVPLCHPLWFLAAVLPVFFFLLNTAQGSQSKMFNAKDKESKQRDAFFSAV